jgi:hypothetical protein
VKKHCPHRTSEFKALMRAGETCCWCGEERVIDGERIPPLGHGDRLPQALDVLVWDTHRWDDECLHAPPVPDVLIPLQTRTLPFEAADRIVSPHWVRASSGAVGIPLYPETVNQIAEDCE